jgi:hypothetical protein
LERFNACGWGARECLSSQNSFIGGGKGGRREDAQIKDAIVPIDHDSIASAGPLPFGKALDAIAQIKVAGVRAILLGTGDTNNAASMIGLGGANGSITSLPVGNVGKEDTLLLLRRCLERRPVEVDFSFTNHTKEHAKVDNVVAEISGHRRERRVCVDRWGSGLMATGHRRRG